MDVTIIIPTYNRLWSLPKAIDSCRDSGLKIEIIVIDDGSTDDTFSWLKSQSDIVAIGQENQGKGWAVNKGVSLSKGKYIRFLDSDDWVLPYSTDMLFNIAEQQNLDVVAAGYQVFDENETLIKDIPWKVCDDFLAQQLGECDSSHYSAYLFKKEFIKEIPHRPEYGSRDDRQFIIEVAIRSPQYSYITSPTLAHRIHSRERLQSAEGLKHSFNMFAALNIYKKNLSLLENQGKLSMRYKQAAAKMLWPLAHWVAKDHLKEAENIVRWVFDLDPHFSIPEKGALGLMYKNLGFKKTELILKFRRLFRYGWK